MQSTLPKPWEHETTFHDVLYEWMSRAPWLMISAAAHLLILFILMAIPWEMLSRQEAPAIAATIEPPPDDIFDDPPPEEPQPIEDETPVDEPVLQDAEAEVDEPDIDDLPAEGDPTEFSDAPFEDFGDNDLIGIGGDPGGKYRNRGFKVGGPKQGSAIHKALQAGLEWLAEHQSKGGSWDCDGFSAECGGIGSTTCNGPGYAAHDVGVTGLALLAFLGAGNTLSEGDHKANVRSGVMWLRSQQD
ncbi:MAG: hypothetical protein O7B99_01735, partial [Planctomycetota bacterium]|nr:hypothetical protein [Planctomycetota bacterium]